MRAPEQRHVAERDHSSETKHEETHTYQSVGVRRVACWKRSLPSRPSSAHPSAAVSRQSAPPQGPASLLGWRLDSKKDSTRLLAAPQASHNSRLSSVSLRSLSLRYFSPLAHHFTRDTSSQEVIGRATPTRSLCGVPCLHHLPPLLTAHFRRYIKSRFVPVSASTNLRFNVFLSNCHILNFPQIL